VADCTYQCAAEDQQIDYYLDEFAFPLSRRPYARVLLLHSFVQQGAESPLSLRYRCVMAQVLIRPERRRRFSLEQKRAILSAPFAPGAGSGSFGVARPADVCASLIYRWRRELGRAQDGFAEVVVAPSLENRWDRYAPRCLPALSLSRRHVLTRGRCDRGCN